MDRLEDAFKTMQQQLEKLVKKEGAEPAGAVGELGAKAKAGAAKPKSGVGDRASHLDPAVLASAREAGIKEDQLQELGRILRKDNKLADLPGLRGRKNELSETEDEEELVEDEDGEAGGEPIQKAVVHLGRGEPGEAQEVRNKSPDGRVGQHCRQQQRCFRKVESRCLQQIERQSTGAPYKTVEELMDQDFAQVRSGPGLASVTTSSRAWLEHRSRLQNLPNTVRLAWQIAGAHDAVKDGNVAEC